MRNEEIMKYFPNLRPQYATVTDTAQVFLHVPNRIYTISLGLCNGNFIPLQVN